MCLDRTLHDGEAQAAPARLGRNEGIEQTVADAGWNARPVVAHAHHHAARTEAGAERRLLTIQQTRLDAYYPGHRRGLYGVEREIEDRAVQQILVTFDRQRPGLRHDARDLNTLAPIR